MQTFRVWAPLPKKVEVQVGAEKFPMRPAENGWWQSEIPSAKIGDDYGFILDGAGPFPDPRSCSQPNGVHKLSRIVDENNFQWTDKNFSAPLSAASLIYELHLGTFTPGGTFISAIEKLDHLVALGITHAELMPVVEFSGAHGWGYDGVDLFAPHHAYGSADDLKKLVDECHARGLGVILDVVYNHLGPSGNYLAKFGPYFTKKYAPTWGEALNYDGADCGEVRRFFCDNALMWLRDFHFDGLRLDAVHAIYDFSAQHFLEQLKLEVEELAEKSGRKLFLIPESDLNDPRLLRPRERGGYNLAAQWSDDFHHALHTVLILENSGYYRDFGKLEQLAKALQNAFVYDGNYSKHRKRKHGASTHGLSGTRFLGYLQNHDQVGNRAQGERSSQLMSAGKLKTGAALVLTSPFVPLLFQGEEWGAATPFLYFTNYEDPELAAAVGAGRCREFAAFGWKAEDVPHPQARETFERSKLNWNELSEPAHAEMFNWHKKLIQLRRAEKDLGDGEMKNVRVDFDEENQWLVVERGSISVACNLAKETRRIPLRTEGCKLSLASISNVNIGADGVVLPSESVAIFQRR
jgi:maltooligosyltrehalose trehalohydrolase